MDLEFSEISQTETNTQCFHLHVESKKKKKKIETDSQTQKTNLWLPKDKGWNEQIRSLRLKDKHY